MSNKMKLEWGNHQLTAEKIYMLERTSSAYNQKGSDFSVTEIVMVSRDKELLYELVMADELRGRKFNRLPKLTVREVNLVKRRQPKLTVREVNLVKR